MKTSLLSRGLIAAYVSASAVVAMVPNWAFAYDKSSTSAVNVDEHGVGVHGYDVVAYFTTGKPTQGKADITAQYDGVTYQFANAADRDAFQAKPEHFAPQFGGFCAFGASINRKLDIDPAAFKVVDDKLYVNLNPDILKKFEADVPGTLSKAYANWPKIKDKAPKDL